MKLTCPMCAEDIAVQDAICPHCGHSLRVVPPPSRVPPHPQVATTARGRFGARYAVPVLLTLATLVAIGVWLVTPRPSAVAPSVADAGVALAAVVSSPRAPPPSTPSNPPLIQQPGPSGGPPPSEVVAAPNGAVPNAPVVMVPNTPCELFAQSDFHLRPSETMRSGGPFYARGTQLQVLYSGALTRNGSSIYRVRLSDSGTEGWMFLDPEETAICGTIPRSPHAR